MEVFCLVRADEGCSAQPKGSGSTAPVGEDSRGWPFSLERGYVRVKRSAGLFARRLNGDLVQMGREGLASKYLRQGGGQSLRVGWLTVKLRNPVA